MASLQHIYCVNELMSFYFLYLFITFFIRLTAQPVCIAEYVEGNCKRDWVICSQVDV